MTLNQFIKQLEKIRDEHGGRMPVCVDSEVFRQEADRLDGTIINVRESTPERVLLADGDGFIEVNKDGSERTRMTLVIR